MTFALPTQLSPEARALLGRDAARFAERVVEVTAPDGSLPGFFDPVLPLTVARAPGRLDVMGGIADYSGSLVLELPLADATLVAIQPATDGAVRVASVPEAGGERRLSELSREALRGGYERARRAFEPGSDTAWAAYVAGCLTALEAEAAVVAVPDGARILVSSTVPEGGGAGSSSALSVATLAALLAVSGARMDGHALALACQKVENRIVGAPSGVMDPLTSVLGEDGCLIELLCQPASVLGHVPVPPGVALFGIDSGVRHRVVGADYGSVRVAAFMGYRIICERAGLTATVQAARATIDDGRFGGYLANVGVSALRSEFLAALPEALLGAEFLQRYGGTTDAVTAIDPGRSYPVRAATAHPIEEHARVRRFAALLRSELDEPSLGELGQLMRAAHRGYGSCGLGSPETDRLVELVSEAGPAAGLYGAKITGGGSGGTVAVLGRAGAVRAVEAVVERYREESGRPARILRGSSPGAALFGALSLLPGASRETKRLEVVS